MLSRMGWAPLARSFRTSGQPGGQKFFMASASINGCNYNNCLSAVVANEGLWLQPWLPFRTFHPPLLIPWNAFSPFEEQKILWTRRYTTWVTTPGGQKVKLVLIPKALENAVREGMRVGAVEIAPAPSQGPWSN